MSRLPVFLLLALLPLGAAAEPAAEMPAEPALCRQARALHPGDPILALRLEERERWRQARRAHREARKRNWRNFAAGATEGAVAGARAFDEAAARYAELVREAILLCGCRAQRGDPDGADCRWRVPH